MNNRDKVTHWSILISRERSAIFAQRRREEQDPSGHCHADQWSRHASYFTTTSTTRWRCASIAYTTFNVFTCLCTSHTLVTL